MRGRALTGTPAGAVQREGKVVDRANVGAMAAERMTRIHWDRVARWALLGVLVLIVYLYIGPTRAWISAYAEAGDKRAATRRGAGAAPRCGP